MNVHQSAQELLKKYEKSGWIQPKKRVQLAEDIAILAETYHNQEMKDAKILTVHESVVRVELDMLKPGDVMIVKVLKDEEE